STHPPTPLLPHGTEWAWSVFADTPDSPPVAIEQLSLLPLKRLCFVKFAPYSDFVAASQKDDKLDLLSEVNNTYRTMCSLFSLLLLLKLYTKVECALPALKVWHGTLLTVLLLLVFLFSYRKQTSYITKRIKANG